MLYRHPIHAFSSSAFKSANENGGFYEFGKNVNGNVNGHVSCPAQVKKGWPSAMDEVPFDLEDSRF